MAVSEKKSEVSTHERGEPGESTRILVVDDNAANRQLLVLMLKHEGFRTLTAKDGVEAVEAYEKASPDLILMDVSMPRMDGMEATRRIKQLAGDHFIPVIFVTALTDQNSLSKCLAAGGDDFISKPIDRVVLIARLKSQLRARQLFVQQYRQRAELTRFREMVEKEQEVAQKIFARLETRHALDCPAIRYRLSPMSVFNGDILLAAQSPQGRQHILLGDFTGHGLAAAIGALPASDIFYAMTGKGYSIAEIIKEINDRLLNLLPSGMFLATCALEINQAPHSVSVWAGGIPDLLIRRVDGSLESVAPRHLPLGVVHSEQLGDEMERRMLSEGDLVYLFSDGVTETQSPSGAFYGNERLWALIGEQPVGPGIFDCVLQDLDHFRAGGEQSDDLTLLQFECRRNEGSMPLTLPDGRPRVSTQWSIGLHFHGESFRYFDPRPIVTHLVMEVQGLYEFKDRLYTILSELYSNALEHGLLQLDSRSKSNPEGFSAYYREREARLNGLTDGWIRLDLRHVPTERGGRLDILVEDSGEGFDYQALAAAKPGEETALSGRGLRMLQRLADELQYYPPGNRVRVSLSWPQTA